ncbi:hypothetical protein ACIB24_22410 [Spongisporangium articulatum]|uniref:NfeD-like C-terminal domain-containing protein n=1 Tax=Spongisporangium articulatum TaxID=3362603 RepID=A0ABW8AUS0_9ACTN
MTGSEIVFASVGATGFLLLLVSLLLGEFLEHDLGAGHGAELPHGVEVGHEAHLEHAGGAARDVELPSETRALQNGPGLYEPTWRSIRVLAAAAVGFGACGYLAASVGLPTLLSWPVAFAGFVAVGAGVYQVILKPLARQQFNSVMSRYSYVGRDAVVTLDILPGGTGQVTFHDRQGARVTQQASADLPEGVTKGSLVRIVDLMDGGVVVHHNTFG